MNRILRLVLRKCYHFVILLWRINLFATIWINFRLLPFRIAIKLPLHCFGKIKFHSLSGKILIEAPIKFGMIKLGYRWWDLWPTAYLPTQILIRGNTVFRGSCTISGGVYLASFRKSSILDIGNEVTIGAGSLIKATEYIFLGERARITGNCTVLDSNMHYIKDIESGIIARPYGSIKIENNCWINPGCVITKGAVLPPYSIVARNSFIGKDMTKFGSCCMFAGSPAKVIKEHVQRIISNSIEQKLSKYFMTHPNSMIYQDHPGLLEDL